MLFQRSLWCLLAYEMWCNSIKPCYNVTILDYVKSRFYLLGAYWALFHDIQLIKMISLWFGQKLKWVSCHHGTVSDGLMVSHVGIEFKVLRGKEKWVTYKLTQVVQIRYTFSLVACTQSILCAIKTQVAHQTLLCYTKQADDHCCDTR